MNVEKFKKWWKKWWKNTDKCVIPIPIEDIMNVEKFKKWWKNTDKSVQTIEDIVNGNVYIDGYKLFVTSGHRAMVGAEKEGKKTITLVDCGSPETREEFYDILIHKFN